MEIRDVEHTSNANILKIRIQIFKEFFVSILDKIMDDNTKILDSTQIYRKKRTKRTSMISQEK